MTTEQKVAQTILQTKETITIGGKEYQIGKPTVATIIMCSELISQMPEIRQVGVNEIVVEVLRTARDTKVIGQICATLILGARRVLEIREERKKAVSHRFSFLKRKTAHKNEFDALVDDILLNASSKEISDLISGRLVNLDLGSFFALTTSLAMGNLLRKTKSEVDAETTRSGQ